MPTLRDAERYVGTPYVEGQYDCASLAVQVQRELFGRTIDLPDPQARRRGRRGHASDIASLGPSLASRVEAPSTGSGVLLWETVPGAAAPHNRRWHIGTAFVEGSDVWVLHCANEQHGALLQRLAHLVDGTMHLEGFYAWRAKAQALDLAIVAHPLSGVVDRRAVPAGRTLADILRAEGVGGEGWIVSIGGREIPPAMWSRTTVKPGQLIEALGPVRKQALQLVAVVALAYFTMGMGGMAGGSFLGLTGASGWIAAGAVYMGGSMMINKLLSPKVSSAGDLSSTQPPPTYALQGGTNRPRPYEPLALVLGETKAVPDPANQPFAWFEGEDQFVSSMFHAGINADSVRDLGLGASPLTNYEEVTVRRYGFPAGNTTQPPIIGTSVDTVEGGLLDAPDGNGPAVIRTTSPNTARIEIDLQATVQRMDTKGKWVNTTVNVVTLYRVVGAVSWSPLGAGVVVITNPGPKPVRRTLGFDVPVGQYEVSLSKSTKNSTGEGADLNMQNEVAWSALKSYQPDTADYGRQPRVELRMKASGQLNGAPDEVNWIVRAQGMPYWNGSAWTTVTEPGPNGTSNGAAQILMLLRGIFRPSDGRLIAGAGLPDSRIDIESLKAFMVRWAAKGFRYDLHLQEALSLGDLLESIASAGLGSMSRRSGRYGVTWMAEDQPIEGVVNMASIKARSFSVEYDLATTADEYQLEYFDAARGYTWQPIRVKAPGVVTPQRTSSENVRGVNYEAHASVLARFAMAQNIYGRKTIAWEMDLEHLCYRRGSVVALSHDLTQWGYGGSLHAVQLIAGGFIVTLDDPVPTTGTAARTLGLHFPGEQQMRIFPVTAVSADGRQLTVMQPFPEGAPLPETPRDVRWIFDFKATPGYRVRIVSIEPSGDMGAQITAVPESAEFWNYVWTGEYIPPPDNSLLAAELPVASNLRVVRGLVLEGEGFAHELTASWDVVGSYDHAQLWAGRAGQPLEQIAPSVFGLAHSWRVPSDQTWNVEVRPFDGLGRMGTRVSVIYTDPAEQVGRVTGLAAVVEANGVMARWKAPQGVAAVGWSVTQLRMGATWETASVVFTGRADSHNLGWLMAGTHLLWAAHRNSAGDWSDPVSTSIQILAPAQPIVVGTPVRQQVELRWEDCRTTQPLLGYEVLVGSSLAEAERLDLVSALGYVRTEETAGTRMYWVVAIDLANNRSAAGYSEVTTLPDIGVAIGELEQGLDDAVDAIAGHTADLAAINQQLADISGASDWDAEAVYSEGGIVKHEGGLYRSLGDGNVGNEPGASSAWWQKIGDFETLGEAVAAHAIQLSDQATRITHTEEGLQAQSEQIDLLASTVTTAQQQAINAAVQEEAETLASDIEAEALARQEVVANITSASSNNLITNPTFDPVGWRYAAAPTTAVDYFARSDAGVPAGAPSARVMRITKSVAQGVSSGRDMRFGTTAATLAEARPGEIVDFSVSVWAPTGTTSNAVHVQMFAVDAANALIAGSLTTRSYNGAAGGWQVLSGVLTLPAGAVAVGGHFAIGDAAAAAQPMWVAEPDVRKRSASALALGASVATTSQAVATLEGKVAASYTVSVQAGNRVAGIRLGTDGATSDFVVLSDKFAWAYQATNEVKYGMVAGLVGGVPSFGFNANMFVDGVVKARMIDANQVNATHVASDTMETRHFKTVTLQAMAGYFGVSGNMLANSKWMNFSGWTPSVWSGSMWWGLNNPNLGMDYRPGGENMYAMFEPVSLGANPNTVSYLLSDWVAVEGGKRYEVSVYSGAHRCKVDVYVEFQDATGAWVGNSDPWQPSAFNDEQGSMYRTLSAAKRIYSIGTAPAAAARGRMIIRKWGTKAAGNDSWMMVTMPYLGVAGPYQTLPSEYSVAGLGTKVTPELITTPSLEALSAVIGLLRTASSGERMEVGYDPANPSKQSVRSYDFNNVMRFRGGTF
nr:host specificity factor TipJ family phage tail protein [Variovorax boronicumulans]